MQGKMISADIRKRENVVDLKRLRNRYRSGDSEASVLERTLIIIGSILTNKVVPGAGCRHIYVTRGSTDPPSCQINESSLGSRHFLLACMRTNIFIIDRFHNSTDIFVPFNCIAGKKLLQAHLLRVLIDAQHVFFISCFKIKASEDCNGLNIKYVFCYI